MSFFTGFYAGLQRVAPIAMCGALALMMAAQADRLANPRPSPAGVATIATSSATAGAPPWKGAPALHRHALCRSCSARPGVAECSAPYWTPEALWTGDEIDGCYAWTERDPALARPWVNHKRTPELTPEDLEAELADGGAP